METKFYDIGINLFGKRFPDPERIIKDALNENVTCFLTGTSMKENRKIDSFLRSHDCYGTAGIHPHNADAASDKDFEEIKTIIKKNSKIVAVGECGLDYDRMFSSKENQIRCLKKHIELAEQLDKPLFLHERDAETDFLKIFANHKEIASKSVVHCFTGRKSTLEKYLELGFSIGITGWICDDRRAFELREAVRFIPPDRILLETDSPFLTPRNVKGLDRTNVPQNIKYVAKDLAKYMMIDKETLMLKAKENTERIFGIYG